MKKMRPPVRFILDFCEKYHLRWVELDEIIAKCTEEELDLLWKGTDKEIKSILNKYK